MKKSLLLIIAVIAAFSANAQTTTIFQRDFPNGDDTTGFTFIDQDGDGNTFILKESYECTTLSLGCENSPVVATRGKGFPEWEITPNIKDWVVLPAQNLLGTSNTKLHITYLKGYMGMTESGTIHIYATTSQDVSDITSTSSIASVTAEGDVGNFPSEAETITVDIPDAYNVDNVSFGIFFDGDGPYSTELAFTKLSIETEIVNSNSYIVWEDDFSDTDVSDWTLVDSDGDGHNWFATNAIALDDVTWAVGYFDEYPVLATYVIDFNTFAAYIPQDNWAVSPEISLVADDPAGHYYNGTFKLNLNAQCAIGEANSSGTGDITKFLYAYASTSPDFDDMEGSFTYLGILDVANPNNAPFGPYPAQFADYELDITTFIENLPTETTPFYIALRHKRYTDGSVDSGDYPQFGFEVNKVTVTASELDVLGITDIKSRNKIQLKQNPVAETLEIQVAENINANDLNLKIYNSNGMLVKESKYTGAGVPVGSLATGMYFVVVQYGTTTEQLKFIRDNRF